MLTELLYIHNEKCICQLWLSLSVTMSLEIITCIVADKDCEFPFGWSVYIIT